MEDRWLVGGGRFSSETGHRQFTPYRPLSILLPLPISASSPTLDLLAEVGVLRSFIVPTSKSPNFLFLLSLPSNPFALNFPLPLPLTHFSRCIVLLHPPSLLLFLTSLPSSTSSLT